MEINIIVLLAGFPFIGGLIYMLVAQLTVENNLAALKAKLYGRMEKLGIDTTPRKLRDIFPPETRDPVEYRKLWQKFQGKMDVTRNSKAVSEEEENLTTQP
jgi:hypothetical protein